MSVLTECSNLARRNFGLTFLWRGTEVEGGDVKAFSIANINF